MRYSVSSIKTYLKSPAEWAGRYILNIKDSSTNDNFVIGRAIHKYFESAEVDQAYLILAEAEDKEKAVKQFDSLVINMNDYIGTEGLRSLIDTTTAEAKMEIADFYGYEILGFIDKLGADCIYDLKSVSALSKRDGGISMRQSISTYDEYALQAWIYMRGTGINKTTMIEIMKGDTTIPSNTTITKDELISYCTGITEYDSGLTKQKIVELYSPKKPCGQSIHFHMTDEFNREMEDRYLPVLRQMNELSSGYSHIIQ